MPLFGETHVAFVIEGHAYCEGSSIPED